MPQLPAITTQQLNLLLHLYKFQFLHTNQCQKLFHHKGPQTVQAWLKDLKDKQYVSVRACQNPMIAHTNPAVYSLTKLARMALKHHPQCDIRVLNYVYRATSVSRTFIDQCLFLADIYLILLRQLEEDEKLHFSTRSQLNGFEYFPIPLPEAFIAIKAPTRTKRYFLVVLDARIPWHILDRRVKRYMTYAGNNTWADYSRDPLPSFLMICPNARTMKHLYDVISSNRPDTPFYLAIQEAIQQSGFTGSAWKRVR